MNLRLRLAILNFVLENLGLISFQFVLKSLECGLINVLNDNYKYYQHFNAVASIARGKK